jgi:hypothetical protein
MWELLQTSCEEAKLGQRNLKQQFNSAHWQEICFSLSLAVRLSSLLFLISFTLFARERGFTAIAVLLVRICK